MWLVDLTISLIVVLLALVSICRTFNATSLPGYDWLVVTLSTVLLLLGISWLIALLIHLRKVLNKDQT